MASTKEKIRDILMETPYIEIMYNIDDAVDYLIDKGVTISEQPTADVVEVVRCEDCAKRYTKNCNAKHERADLDFCSSGIR